MTLPVYPNPISLEQLRAEFGGSTPISFNSYHAGLGLVPSSQVGFPIGVETFIPAGSGTTISFGNFHNGGIVTGNNTGIQPVFLYGSINIIATLPRAACWVKIDMIGGGGGGGGDDLGFLGGNGGAGVRMQGLVRLPETASTKYLYASVGGGGPAGLYNGTPAAGGGGYYYSSGARFAGAIGGAGGLFGGSNISGSGGGGGGPTVLDYRDGPSGTTISIASVSGGGGGGGTGRYTLGGGPGPTPGNQNNINTLYYSTQSIPLVPGETGQGRAQYGGYDGGGCGGGGAPGGVGGVMPLEATTDKFQNVTYAPYGEAGATGGSAGYVSYNNLLTWNTGPVFSNPLTQNPGGSATYGWGGGSSTAGTPGVIAIAYSTQISVPSLTLPTMY